MIIMANLANTNSPVRLLLLLLCLLSLFCALIHVSSAQYIIRTLPGYNGTLPFTLETGYIGIDENEEIQLFYYFTESEGNPEKDPLILWLTGGPGCSGFCGLIFEIGPIHFNDPVDDGKLPTLRLNPFSWTQSASIIFIDAPVGTGFSYTTLLDYKLSDTQNARDNYQFLKKWLIAHPRFSNNPVYIGGDSFGGAVVPIVTYLIAKGIEAGDTPSINLKGYHVGNAVTDVECDQNSRIPFANGMALLPKESYELIRSSCKGEYVNPDPTNSLCLSHLQLYYEVTDKLNPNHILEAECPKFDDSRSIRSIMEEISMYNLLKLSPDDFKPRCRSRNYVMSRQWANDPAVQEAIHVRKGTLKSEWQRCKRNLTYEMEDSVVEYHQKLSTSGYRALVYSGDHDLSYPYLGTLDWINKLNFTITDYWRPWFVDQQVAGYTQKYKNDRFDMTFATVKGAGHTAAEYKPKECFRLFQRWISYEEL